MEQKLITAGPPLYYVSCIEISGELSDGRPRQSCPGLAVTGVKELAKATRHTLSGTGRGVSR